MAGAMTLKYALSWVLWPALFIICMSITAYGFAQDQVILYFNVAYIFLIIAMIALERWMPHEHEWTRSDGQIFADIAHTISSKGTVQLLFLFSAVIGLAEWVKPMVDQGPGLLGVQLWPLGWPLWAQVCLGVVAAEFGLYWAHRLAHQTPVIWRLHAIHHSVKKLWFVNTGRFHVMDSVFKIALSFGVLLLLGAPMEVVKWLSAITAFIGMMTHCNIEMRFGWLNYVFNTPELHRWHHSKVLDEGNRNYGENVIIWDLVFGTYYNEARRPPVDIGMSDYMPQKFIHQLAWPFLGEQARRRLDPAYADFVKPENAEGFPRYPLYVGSVFKSSTKHKDTPQAAE
jgi:sterol desaturase/sphingolipid hydroxylase (fatty acid hydroxylase superfamily)